MEQRIKTERDSRIFRSKLFRLLRITGVLFVVLCVALVGIFVPYQSLLPAYAVEERKEGELRVHFLNAGEGDCSIVEFPDGALLVIDAGSGDFSCTNHILRYMKGLRKTSVSYVVTHADSDHYGGMARLISCFGADTVYLPAHESESRSYLNMKQVVGKKARQTDTLTRYDVISHPSGAYLVCISPYTMDEGDDNDSSAVLYLAYHGVRVLFGGDISSVRERRLLRDLALSEDIFDSGDYHVRLNGIDVLKASHHGSAYSSCSEWLALLSPEVAVLSCGKGNFYSHPAIETVRRLSLIGAQTYRTDEFSAIVLGITAEGYTVKTR